MNIGREAEIQRIWGEGAFRGKLLSTQSGECFRVVYEGRRGAGAGPDFRDAVLVDEHEGRRYGDVEIHLRAANWRAHGHDRDHHYDAVALHVVLNAGAERETALAGGTRAPLAVLDLTTLGAPPESIPESIIGGRWPCDGLARRVDGTALRGSLSELGIRRLDERAARFAEELGCAERCGIGDQHAHWDAGYRVLWAALAEGLGYGRDREALRAAGMRLISEDGDLGERCDALPSIERSRVAGLRRLLERWRAMGPWEPLHKAIERGTPGEAGICVTRALCVGGGAVSVGRARILAANVVLPFAVARARVKGDLTGERRAIAVYGALAAPPSNTLTRLLVRQFGMGRLPSGAASHMGLQHVWTTWCRQKLCAGCPCAGSGHTGQSSASVEDNTAENATNRLASSTMGTRESPG